MVTNATNQSAFSLKALRSDASEKKKNPNHKPILDKLIVNAKKIEKERSARVESANKETLENLKM